MRHRDMAEESFGVSWSEARQKRGLSGHKHCIWHYNVSIVNGTQWANDRGEGWPISVDPNTITMARNPCERKR